MNKRKITSKRKIKGEDEEKKKIVVEGPKGGKVEKKKLGEANVWLCHVIPPHLLFRHYVCRYAMLSLYTNAIFYSAS